MKPHYKYLATALAATLQLAVLAAVPLSWDVRPGQPAPVTFDRYHGETLEFRCTFRGFSPDGQTVFGQNEDIRLWYQTNGMGSAWWSVTATIQSNVLSATWSPELDPGADRVALFFGAPSNAYAAAVLRLRHSPGFSPATPPPPATFTESDPVFSTWLSTFTIPETSLEPSTNYTDRSLSAFAATGTVFRSASYGTPTRWTDATGCVWEVSFDSWRAENLGLQDGVDIAWQGPGWNTDIAEYYYDRVGWFVSNDQFTPEFLGDDPNSTMLELDWSYYDGLALHAVHTIFSRPTYTNLVGRVALTNDIPSTAGFATPQTVTNTVRSLSLGGIWDEALQVWWTPVMRNGSLTYQATTNVNLNAEN